MGAIANWLAAVALAGAAPPSRPSTTDLEAALMEALRSSEVAEIYIVRRDLTSPLGLRPHNVRQFGCRYFIHRSMRRWQAFQQAIAAASVRFERASVQGEMRVGLVFGDRAGTVLEAYSSDLPMPDGRAKGYVQRQEMAISASLAETLRAFAEANRNLAVIDEGRPDLCAPEQSRQLSLSPSAAR